MGCEILNSLHEINHDLDSSKKNEKEIWSKITFPVKTLLHLKSLPCNFSPYFLSLKKITNKQVEE